MIDPSKLPFQRIILKPSLELAPSGFLYDRENGESYTLNPTGALIFRTLYSGYGLPQAWAEVSREFSVPLEKAQWDTLRFLARLRELHLATLTTAVGSYYA